MTTELHLLTLSAAAIGYEVLQNWPSFTVRKADGFPHKWDPLSSSNDAFELLAHLRMHIGTETHAVSAWVPSRLHSWASVGIGIDGDVQAATRRAIVLCASTLAPAPVAPATPTGHKLAEFRIEGDPSDATRKLQIAGWAPYLVSRTEHNGSAGNGSSWAKFTRVVLKLPADWPMRPDGVPMVGPYEF